MGLIPAFHLYVGGKNELRTRHLIFFVVSVYLPVEKRTVYELFLQLYVEPYAPGMQWVESRTYQNMTDQMLHLVSRAIVSLLWGNRGRPQTDGKFDCVS